MKKIYFFFFILIIFLLQESFISPLPFPFFYFNLLLSSLVLLLFFFSFELALAGTLIAGILLDLQSYYFFGLHILSLAAAIVLAFLILYQFFTNRSLYSLMLLSAIATAAETIARVILLWVANLFNESALNNIISWESWLYPIIFNAVLVAAVFYLVHYFSTKVKAVFITR